MPLVDIYTSKEKARELKNILSKLREFVAKELTCKERTISQEEISIRIINPLFRLSIADIEINIIAYSYPTRVKNQDKICLSIKNFIDLQKPSIGSVFVSLQLSELGHSVEE